MPSAAFDMRPTSASPSGAVGGSAYVPEEDRDLGPSDAPRLKPRPAFYYFTHPERWQVLDGKILPLPGKLKLRAGVMGVTASRRKKGSVSLRLARVACEEKGRTIIPINAVPAAHVAQGEPASYLRTIDAAGGPVTVSAYEQAFAGSSETRPDRTRWVEFLENLVAGGFTKPAPTWVLEKMRDQRVKSLERMEANGSTNKAKSTRLAEEVEVLNAELKRRNDNAKPVSGSAAAPNVEE